MSLFDEMVKRFFKIDISFKDDIKNDFVKMGFIKSEKEIKDAIALKIADIPNCMFCNSDSWGLVNGYTYLELSNKYKEVEFIVEKDIRYVPCVAINCSNCGFVANFSAVVMGAIK